MARIQANHCIVHATPLNVMFQDLHDQPEPTFAETIDPIEQEGCIPGVRVWSEETFAGAQDRKKYGDLVDDPLPVDNVATVMKYCAEDSTPTFYSEVTSRCYIKDRRAVMPFKLYLWKLVKSMEMLEPYRGKTVNRGVKVDLKAEYPKGREFVWYGPVSTTKTIEVLSNPMFLGCAGKRTIFQIELTQNQARDITKYSPLDEGEVLLPPGCKFRVTSALVQPDLTIIQLVELTSPHWILDLSRGQDKTTSSPFHGVWKVLFDGLGEGLGTWTINTHAIIYEDPTVSTATVSDRWESPDMLTFRLAMTYADKNQGYSGCDITLRPSGDLSLEGKQTADGKVMKFRMIKK